jgi:hypothetical protein
LDEKSSRGAAHGETNNTVSSGFVDNEGRQVDPE